MCGLEYKDFRAPGQCSFAAAVQEAKARSMEAQARGDYTVQGRRGTALMVMREYKLVGWQEHLYWCEMEFQHE